MKSLSGSTVMFWLSSSPLSTSLGRDSISAGWVFPGTWWISRL